MAKKRESVSITIMDLAGKVFKFNYKTGEAWILDLTANKWVKIEG